MRAPKVAKQSGVETPPFMTDVSRVHSLLPTGAHGVPASPVRGPSGAGFDIARIPLLAAPVAPQAKRWDGASNGAHEREADQVAGNILRMPASHAAPAPRPLRRAPAPALTSSGTPLSEELRSFFEPRFGLSLGHVRIHTGADADRATRARGARAFALGGDVMFARGQYAPGTSEGRHVLAHELTHVVQQSGGMGAWGGGPSIHAAAPGVPQLLSWAEIRNSVFNGLIEGLRIARRAGISALRAGVSRLAPSMHRFANMLVDVVDGIAEVLTALILAVVGLITGFGEGIVEAVIGLIQLVLGIVEGLIRWLWSVFTMNPTHFNQWAERVGGTIAGIPDALRQTVNAWLREFETASSERQTLMIGELTGRVLAVIATIYVTGNLPPSALASVPVPALTTTGELALATAEVAVPVATPVGVAATGSQILMMAGRRDGSGGGRGGRPPQQQQPPPRPVGPLTSQT
ncbi:eCIS core domain-containing protein, partial [Corallococcus exiguus]|uniref:eCIS core domain-containing protein n=1 Tax=Corallococcus exiguus TaxID=83462 RepID=UPI0014947783